MSNLHRLTLQYESRQEWFCVMPGSVRSEDKWIKFDMKDGVGKATTQGLRWFTVVPESEFPVPKM
jgi:hypothetical protein